MNIIGDLIYKINTKNLNAVMYRLLKIMVVFVIKGEEQDPPG